MSRDGTWRVLVGLVAFQCMACGEPEPGPDAAGNLDGRPLGDGSSSDGDEQAWEPVDPCCISAAEFPPGAVRCDRENPQCPVGYPYCCTISCGCYYMFEESGCCRDRFCGAGVCREAPVTATRSLCPLPEPEHRCPPERPHCCTVGGMGLAYCSDHELYGWLCGW